MNHFDRNSTHDAVEEIQNMNSKSKRTNEWRITAVLILGAAFLTLAGCVSSRYQKSEAAAASLQMAANEVQAESRSLDLTLNALKDLVNKPPADLKLQYEGFGNNLDHLIASARRNEAALRRVGEKSAAYFQSWDEDLATMSFEAVRARSQARKTEVTANFDSIYRRYRETQSTVQPLLDYFQDIRKALGTDLTVGGLEAMKPTISKVNENSSKVQTALARLADDLAASGTQMSSITVQTSPTSTK